MEPNITEKLFIAWKNSNESWAKFTEIIKSLTPPGAAGHPPELFVGPIPTKRFRHPQA